MNYIDLGPKVQTAIWWSEVRLLFTSIFNLTFKTVNGLFKVKEERFFKLIMILTNIFHWKIQSAAHRTINSLHLKYFHSWPSSTTMSIIQSTLPPLTVQHLLTSLSIVSRLICLASKLTPSETIQRQYTFLDYTLRDATNWMSWG